MRQLDKKHLELVSDGLKLGGKCHQVLNTELLWKNMIRLNETNKRRIEIIKHSEIPSDLKLTKVEKKFLRVNKHKMKKKCVLFRASVISRNLRRHHYHHNELVEDKLISCVEVNDKWNDKPSKYFIIRAYRNRNDEGMVEISELYWCRDCEVYCWSNNRIQMNYDYWSVLQNL